MYGNMSTIGDAYIYVESKKKTKNMIVNILRIASERLSMGKQMKNNWY
jgi:hypothetical protein